MRRVKNVLVTNRSLFEKMLVCSLIDYNVSYLQIDHEFHIFDCIYRFYELNKGDYDRPPILDKDSIKCIPGELSNESIMKSTKDIYIHNKDLSKQKRCMLNQKLKNNRI